MAAKTLADLLSKNDRVAVSNITGREASTVCEVTQRYASNIVGGWALGRGGDKIVVDQRPEIPVFSDYAEMLAALPRERHPNKITIYSPPEAVYGEIKNVLSITPSEVQTFYIITEHVAVEVSAKIHNLCREQGIDIVGCNTLGAINVTDHVRIGAVGGDHPEEGFHPGGATIISNSGNMVNTMASYLQSAGIGVRMGISTGKDQLILKPLRDLLELSAADAETKVLILYVEPGGLYEQIAVQWMEQTQFAKPLIVYVGGIAADERNLSLGHAGAVVEGPGTSAKDKMALFDQYLGVDPFRPGTSYKNGHQPARGLRIQTLHDLPSAAQALYDALGIERDSRQFTQLRLNPWLKNMGSLGKRLPAHLMLGDGNIPSPYREQILEFHKTQFGRLAARRDMRNASHASSNDGATPRIYGHNVIKIMEAKSFAYSLILGWTGYPPSHAFEAELVEQSLIASYTNGPGTISAQAAKLSAAAGNDPHTAMIATLAAIGSVHGGNGQQAVTFMVDAFANTKLVDPYDASCAAFVEDTAKAVADKLLKQKLAAAEQDVPFERVPCMGHPVYRNEDVNYDPRERVIWHYLEKKAIYHAFFHFYHHLAGAMRQAGITRNVLAVNVDAAIACTWLGICWPLLCDKRITVDRAKKIPVVAFALGRAAGGASEYLDHSDFGQPMDMRIPVAECNALTPPKES